MRVAIDARELLGQPTGVGRYLAGILGEWQTLPAAASHDFVLCAPEPVEVPLVRAGRASTVVGRGRGTWWEQNVLPGLVRRAGADVLFAPAYTGPLLCPAPMVVTIHDVSYVAHPEWFSTREGLRRRVLTRLTAGRAACVLTVSEFSKREIVDRLGIKPAKVEVIYQGIAPCAPDSPARSTRDSRLTILYVGSLFTRRHIPDLIDAFDRLALNHPDARIEIVGDNRTLPPIDVGRLAAAADASDRIRLRAYVSEAELSDLYASARAFVFLSDYEGFGITPLEALAAGVPIVVLDTAVAREVYGSAALYVARPDPPLVEQALHRILTDEAERARILAAAGGVLARYSWRACAEQVLNVLVRTSTCRDSR